MYKNAFYIAYKFSFVNNESSSIALEIRLKLTEHGSIV